MAPRGPWTKRRLRGRLPGLCLLAAAALAAGCGGDHEWEPPDREQQVAEAESLYAAARFDTISWQSDSARLFTGNELYAAECRDCHGYLGRGDTRYARRHDLDVPSLVESDWEYAGSPDSVRKRIYTGHPEGMPTWGEIRLTPRQIDAVAHYVLNSLRPDALDEERR